MSEPITYVGIDAHKVELHVALLAPDASAPVTWKVQNEARAVERLRRKLEKGRLRDAAYHWARVAAQREPLPGSFAPLRPPVTAAARRQGARHADAAKSGYGGASRLLPYPHHRAYGSVGLPGRTSEREVAKSAVAALATALNRLDQRFPASVAAIRVAALTGLRISEVLAIRWGHVDFASRRVALPQTKTGRHSHHFPRAALDIVRAVPRLNKGDHVFAVDARGALTYRTVRHHFGEAAKLAGCRTCGCTTFGARS